MIAIHLHPPLDREPDYRIDSLAILRWWKRGSFSGGAVLVDYGKLLSLLKGEPGNEALKRELARQEDFTMASLTLTA